MRNWRQAIAHAASPWEWRSRRRVVALVVVAVVGSVAGLVWMASGNDAPSILVSLPIFVALAYVTGVSPALRSLRRWDVDHGRSPGLPG